MQEGMRARMDNHKIKINMVHFHMDHKQTILLQTIITLFEPLTTKAKPQNEGNTITKLHTEWSISWGFSRNPQLIVINKSTHKLTIKRNDTLNLKMTGGYTVQNQTTRNPQKGLNGKAHFMSDCLRVAEEWEAGQSSSPIEPRKS